MSKCRTHPTQASIRSNLKIELEFVLVRFNGVQSNDTPMPRRLKANTFLLQLPIINSCNVRSENDRRPGNAERLEWRHGRRRYIFDFNTSRLLWFDALTTTGAFVHACVNLQIKPSKHFNVHFSPVDRGNKCMNEIGSDVDVTVNSSGLTCGYIGYAESKASSSGGDFCATQASLYHISYATSGLISEKSGSLRSQWYYSFFNDDEIALEAYPNGTKLCSSGSLCDTTSVTWPSGVGLAYVSYAPCGNNCRLTRLATILSSFSNPKFLTEEKNLCRHQ